MYKRLLFIILPLILFLSACGATPTGPSALQTGVPGEPSGVPQNSPLSVVCTVFPQYDWARQILGGQSDAVSLTLLQTSQVDLHNFQPSVSDILEISTCDVFIYVGGESDEWVADVLAEAANPDMVVINMLDVLGGNAKAEELTEGMEDDEEHAHENEAEHEEEPVVYDEHVWMSLRNASVICQAIYEQIVKLDEGNESKYEANFISYVAKLNALDKRYSSELENRARNTLVFGDRFPFRYLTDDYGIAYFAAFPGCSADTEAGFETLVFLTEKVEELDLDCIMVTETSDESIANIIRESTAQKNQRIITLNAMQSISANIAEDGASYLGIMEENLEALKEALCRS